MRQVFFDATRLFVRGSRFSPTGIDRVVMAYARWLLAEPEVALQPVATVGGAILACPRSVLAGIVEGAAAFQAAMRRGWEGDAAFMALVAALNAIAPHPERLRAKSVARQLPARAVWHAGLLARIAWRLRPAALGPDAVYLNVSHTGLDHPRVLSRAAAAGARPVVMVHDLIPITHPEYCAPSAEARHARRMDAVLRHASAVIANSRTTADELAAYARGLGSEPPATLVAPLGLEADFLTPPPPVAASRPYFVCLGTLEARKNLAFLLALWRTLAERLGEATPHLVLVGRRGWENEAVIDHLHRSKTAHRYVHEVCDLQDAQVASLIAGAAALLGPSFAEGYDLPVVEALSVGTAVIASDIPVHRELAAGALLLDPLDGPTWLKAIEAAALKPAPRRPQRGPRWADHFAAVRELVLGAS